MTRLVKGIMARGELAGVSDGDNRYLRLMLLALRGQPNGIEHEQLRRRLLAPRPGVDRFERLLGELMERGLIHNDLRRVGTKDVMTWCAR